ncbi:MAG TPA: hypothetical protein VGH14_17000, partial [Solirubrobacterales bacterium]
MSAGVRYRSPDSNPRGIPSGPDADVGDTNQDRAAASPTSPASATILDVDGPKSADIERFSA